MIFHEPGAEMRRVLSYKNDSDLSLSVKKMVYHYVNQEGKGE